MNNIFKIIKFFFRNNFRLKYKTEIPQDKSDDLKEIKNTKKYKIKIITSYDDKFKDIGNITSKTFRSLKKKLSIIILKIFQNIMEIIMNMNIIREIKLQKGLVDLSQMILCSCLMLMKYQISRIKSF